MANTKKRKQPTDELTTMSVTTAIRQRVEETRREWQTVNDAVLAAWETGFNMLPEDKQMEARFAVSRNRRAS